MRLSWLYGLHLELNFTWTETKVTLVLLKTTLTTEQFLSQMTGRETSAR